MAYLELDNVRYRQGDFELDISLSLEKGKVGVLAGPSGCGKTTLLRLVAGLEKPESGTIIIDGKNLESVPTEKRGIGFIFQDLAIFEHLSGESNITFGLKRLGNAPNYLENTALDLSRRMRIEHLLKRRPSTMSGGERQRLAVARALAVQPSILILDEPLSALDAPLRRELRAYFSDLFAERGMTVLYVTHDVDEAFELGDVIFLLRNGKLVVAGTPEELWHSPKDCASANFLGLGSILPVPGWLHTPEKSTEQLGLFIPPEAVSLAEEASSSKGVGKSLMIFMKGKVLRSAFSRGRRLVSIRAFEGGSNGEPLVFSELFPFTSIVSMEFEPGSAIHPSIMKKGCEIKLAIDLELCRILPVYE